MEVSSSPAISGRKIKWSPEEDRNLTRAVNKYGTHSWVRIATLVSGRTSKQCRERWLGQLAPCVLKSDWTADEDRRLLDVHASFGNQWSVIAHSLPGRSTISVKNRWSWLVRHNVPQRYAPGPTQVFGEWVQCDDVREKPPPKPQSFLLDPAVIPDALFGPRFREFQAKMLGETAPHLG
jgi:hypothetical protein